jgi:hypothetical protein
MAACVEAAEKPAVPQHQRESPRLRLRFHRDLDQLRFAVLPASPVIESRNHNLVFGAILPPRHSAFDKALDEAPDFLLASDPAIFSSIARAINTGSSDAYSATEQIL